MSSESIKRGVGTIRPRINNRPNIDSTVLELQSPTMAARVGDIPFICLTGIPRSGTTWINELLGFHPLIGVGNESFLFSKHIIPQLREYYWGLGQPERGGLGLATFLGEGNFLDALRAFSERLQRLMIASCAEKKPQISIFVDKSPPHSLMIPEIRMLHPSMRFIVMIRNPYDLIASWNRSQRTWAPWIGTSRIPDLIDILWSYFQAIANTLDSGDAAHILLVAYEDLWRNPSEVLRAVGRFLDVTWDTEILASTVKSVDLREVGERSVLSIPLYGAAQTRYGPHVLVPPGFVGHASPSAGELTLSRSDRREIRDRLRDLECQGPKIDELLARASDNLTMWAECQPR